MKLYAKILICVVGMMTSGLLLATGFNTDSIFFDKIAEIIGITSSNLLNNGDFKDDLNSWKHDENTSVIDTNGLRHVYIKGNNSSQTRIWQEINVISGQTYELTFTLSGPSTGGFAIFRDDKIGEEKYLWCNGNNENKHYKMMIYPTTTGSHRLFLSACTKGNFYYSNLKIKKNSDTTKLVYIAIAFLIILLLSYYHGMLFAIVILLALIPVVKMTKQNKSVSENRTLVEYKPLFNEEKKLNKNYGLDFNQWINDHFWLRDDFMKNQNSLKYLIDGKVDNKFVLQGKDKWFFLKGNLKRLANPESYYNSIYDETAEAIKRFNSFCEEKGAKLYIVIAPFGEEIYSSEVVGVDISKKVGGFGKYIESLNEDTGAKIIYAYEALEKAKSEGLVQYKTDHHWTEFGAYNVYKVIREDIFKDFNITQAYQAAFKVNKKKYDFGYGETFNRVSNISETFTRRIYPDNAKYLKFTPEKSLVINDNGSRIVNESGINKSIFLFGDSYTRNIKTFFGYDFSNIQYQVKPLQISMPQFEKQIAKLKPDIVVMIIYSQNYNLIKNWYR